MSVLRRNRDGILYCVAWEYYSSDPRDPYNPREARAGFDYCHARSQAHAMHKFRCQLRPEERYRIRIAWCAPVIGFKVHDNHGDILSA